MERLVRTTIFLSRAERAALKKIAAKQNVSAANLTRRVLDAFLGIEPKKPEPVKFEAALPAK